MSILRSIISLAVPLPGIERFDRFLFIGPHPDDIEIGAGATAAKLAAAGKKIRFLICTDGRFGLENAPKGMAPEELAVRRRQEALDSAKILGIKDVRFLSFSDGGLYSEADLFSALLREISAFAPDVIFCPDPCVTSECHTDHLRVGEACRRAACFAPNAAIMKAYGTDSVPVQAVAFYMTAKANRFINTSGFLVKQLEAIFTCHTSQFPPESGAAKSLSLYLKLRACDFGLRSLSKSAEGFRVLGQTQMHCLPEAGD